MRQKLHSATETNGENEYRENWTAGGFLGTVLVVPVVVAFMTVPAVVAGTAAGALGLTVGERLYHRVSRFVTHRRPATSRPDHHAESHTVSN